MSKSAPSNSPDKAFQEQVQRWIDTVAEALPEGEVSSDYLNLSPVKREKHTGPNPASVSSKRHYAARVVLRLLAERVVRLRFSPAPAMVAAGFGPALTPAEETASREVKAEIGKAEFDSWSLAALNFSHLDRKRSGAYYTSPDLARRITKTALTTGHAEQPILDPACGGGIFLLAALDHLHKLLPKEPLDSLVIERLYGLDLNPLAVLQTRIAVLKRLFEIKSKPFFPSIMVAIGSQIRCGNALVGPVAGEGEAEGAVRGEFFRSIRSGDGLATLEQFAKVEPGLEEKRKKLAAEIAALPIFNDPGDGATLAALRPFGWAAEFPEVFAKGGFGTVLGNPPYVGFNDYSGVEKAYFARTFPEVYNLKADLLYYFIRRGVELLAPGGRLGFVTSRFWKEAAFAAPLRGWLLSETSLLELEDLGGEQHFSDAEVDVCLLYAARQSAPPDHTLLFRFDGHKEEIPQHNLSGKTPWTWLRQIPAERLLLAEIAEKSCELGEIALCRTGVQTGLDRVFFVDDATAKTLDPAILKRAIKNADVTPGRVRWSGQWMLYPPSGFDPKEFAATLAYLEPYRAELERRQRYTKSFPFYELQWPREPEVFEAAAKLVTPYKAPRNTFAVDRQQFYFSTDVISIVFPPDWELEDFAANFLNSRLSTFQFRSYGKPMGGGQWDYYANPVKKLAFPKAAVPDIPGPKPSGRPAELLRDLSRPALAQADLDELVFALYDLTKRQVALIRKSV